MKDSMLNITDLRVSYKNKIIIKQVSFQVNEGEIVGLIGPNGAGKTTLLRAMLGLEDYDSGIIHYNKEKISFPKHYKYIGYASDQSNFYPFLDARENLKIFSLGNCSEEDIDKTLDMVGLENCKNKKVSEFSLGMKQRLNIARSMIFSPRVLFMDEPLNGLDPIGVREFKDYIKMYLSSENAALILSSHALKDIIYFCNKFIFINNGKVFTAIEDKGDLFECNAFIECHGLTESLVHIFKDKSFYTI